MQKDRNPPRRVGEILGEIKLVPDCPPPPERKQECSLCHLEFLSRPQWFCNKWMYPNVCVHCGDNYSHTQEMRNGPSISFSGKHLEPRSEFDSPMLPKRFHCPKCYHQEIVKPTREGAYWAYNGKCSKCESEWINLYHAYKRKAPSEEYVSEADPD